MIGILQLLSRIRLSRNEVDFDSAARRQFLFPLAGLTIGIIVALFAFLVFGFLRNQFDSMIIGFIVVVFFYSLTGLIHLEGLADFADGLMASGDADRKRGAMKDASLGAAGCFSLVVAVILLFLLVSRLDGEAQAHLFIWGDSLPLVIGLAVSEISAKLSMNTAMFLGPASHEGMGTIFIREANGGKYLLAIMISAVIGIIISGVYFLIIFSGIITGIIITYVSRKHFHGVGGDSFGACNEVGRLSALFLWLLII